VISGGVGGCGGVWGGGGAGGVVIDPFDWAIGPELVMGHVSDLRMLGGHSDSGSCGRCIAFVCG
jgi:hypothetical protein